MTEEDEVGHLEVTSDFKLRVTNYDHNSFPDESCYEKGLEELTKVACQSNDESVLIDLLSGQGQFMVHIDLIKLSMAIDENCI